MFFIYLRYLIYSLNFFIQFLPWLLHYIYFLNDDYDSEIDILVENNYQEDDFEIFFQNFKNGDLH